MKKTIKFLGIILIASTFLLSSCLTEEEKVVRTAEMELAEIKDAIEQLEFKGHNVDTTELGVYYVISKAGEGPTVEYGDTISLAYDGYLLDGYIFDSSQDHYTNGIWTFVFEEDELIPGFEDGIKLMKTETKIDIIIPSSLAYGALGQGLIGPYQALLFSMRMFEIKPHLEI